MQGEPGAGVRDPAFLILPARPGPVRPSPHMSLTRLPIPLPTWSIKLCSTDQQGAVMTPCFTPVKGQSAAPTSSSKEGLGGFDLSLPSHVA